MILGGPVPGDCDGVGEGAGAHNTEPFGAARTKLSDFGPVSASPVIATRC